jgi:hypothetical protein
MAKTSDVTKAEIRFAVAFLRYMQGNWRNQLLITAVIAWLRQESGSLKRVIGNNPFNIRPGMTNKFANGYRCGKHGCFQTFATLEKAAQATAYLLMHGSHAYGYYVIVAAARRLETNDKRMNEQALDFLTALAMSSWDGSHYGAKDGDASKNHLVKVWVSLTEGKKGFIASVINDYIKEQDSATPGKSKPKPKKDQQYLAAFLAHGNFINGYDTGAFYDARHKNDTVLE